MHPAWKGRETPEQRYRRAGGRDDDAATRDHDAGRRDDDATDRDLRAEDRERQGRLDEQALWDRVWDAEARGGDDDVRHATELRTALTAAKASRNAARADRTAARDDRRTAGGDRHAAAGDRVDAHADRDQSVVESGQLERDAPSSGGSA